MNPKNQRERQCFLQGYAEAEAAYGKCKFCYGKGYSTVLNDPHLGRGVKVLPCKCPRGKAIRELAATGSINLG
jgi:hypothetical protein